MRCERKKRLKTTFAEVYKTLCDQEQNKNPRIHGVIRCVTSSETKENDYYRT